MATTVVIPNPMPVSISQSISIRVSAAATSGMTVASGSYVIASYTANTICVSLYVGPGQSVPATVPGGATFTSGVVFTNT